jgi:microcystin-dependent protein
MPVNGKSRRSYTGSAVPNTLGSQLELNATTISLSAAMVGWSNDGVPFFVVVEPGTAKEEKICVKYNTSTSLIVVNPAATSVWAEDVLGRGVDDTSDQVHAAGSVIYPVFTSIEANQANELVSKYANAGSVVYQGTGTPGTFTELAIGTASHVLRVNSGVPQWGQVASGGIADTAVTLQKLATAVANALCPVGSIMPYAGDTAPSGWLLCNGASTSGYTALAALVGATTPDLRGRTLIGAGTGGGLTNRVLGTTGGAETHVLTTAEMPSHTHTQNAHSHGAQIYNEGPFTETFVGSGGQGGSISYTVATLDTTATNQNTGGGNAHNNMQPFHVVNYIIKHD